MPLEVLCTIPAHAEIYARNNAYGVTSDFYDKLEAGRWHAVQHDFRWNNNLLNQILCLKDCLTRVSLQNTHARLVSFHNRTCPPFYYDGEANSMVNREAI